ncbi:hypothetical protein DINM_004104 [Dirofilaria immitis]|nr:hypothetical protein [Dirofilaria immitis]
MVGFYKCVDCEAYFERGRLLLYNKVFESTELLSTEYELSSVQVSSTELPSTVLPSVELKSTKLASTELPSVTIIKEDETSIISSMERKILVLSRVQTIRRLQFNESIIIRMKHSSYDYSRYNKNQCVIMFKFLDAKESEIIRFIVIPGAAEFKLVCANRPAAATATTFKNNSYKKSYEFVIVFSSVGIMLFYMNHPYINTMYCINQIPDISKFIHTAAGTYNFEAILEQRPAEFLMPNNWILSKHIPVNRKLTFEYFPGFERTRIERVYIRRRAIDPWYFAPCNNKYFTGPKLGKLEISIFSNRFTIGLRVNTEDNKMDMLECTIYGNLVNSDGIQEAIFSSTNPYTIVYAQYIYSMNLY